jgi:hypothetical protein
MFLDRAIKLLNIVTLKVLIPVSLLESLHLEKKDIDGVTLVIMKNRKKAQEQDFMDNFSFFQQRGLILTE